VDKCFNTYIAVPHRHGRRCAKPVGGTAAIRQPKRETEIYESD